MLMLVVQARGLGDLVDCCSMYLSVDQDRLRSALLNSDAPSVSLLRFAV